MGFLGWVVIGLVAGSLSQRLTGTKRGGCLFSVVVGVLGAIIGGALFQAATGEGLGDFGWRSLVVALIGSVLLLLVLDALSGGRLSKRR